MRFPQGAADIWFGAPCEPRDEDLAVLSAAERHRVYALRSGASADYAAAHVGLRRILAGYLDVRPDRLRLGRSLCPECGDPAHGPPRVLWPETDLAYSFSRSAGAWLLGVTRGRPLGVDLEAREPVSPEQTAPIAFTEAELAHLLARSGPERDRLFLCCWTRKEAVVKAVGVGLVADLCRIEVYPQHQGPVLVSFGLPPGPEAWTVQGLDLAPGVTAALARTDGSTGPVRIRHYGADPLPGGAQPPGPARADTPRQDSPIRSHSR